VKTYRIAVIPGDGIGKEVVPEGLRVLEAAGRKFDIEFKWDEFPWSCEYRAKHGRMMPEDGLAAIRHHDAIFFGAAGFPGVPDHISLWEMLIPMRRQFDLYVNLRPVRLMPGIKSPLADRKAGDVEFWVVRENTEGEYSSIGGRIFDGMRGRPSCRPRPRATASIAFSSMLELARKRPETSHLGDQIQRGITLRCLSGTVVRDGELSKVDGINFTSYSAAHFVQHPDWFDVVVGSNLFGDILSDLGPACAGTIAIAPSANINPEREYPSLFEPVHGSAPDIAGKKIANPIGQIWSAAMMLEHLGHPDAADAIVKAIETVLGEGPRTRDIGGSASTEEAGKAIAAAV
jgi:tartrate dehydrogenase/decarboxylase/D-malate dehydrogenase